MAVIVFGNLQADDPPEMGSPSYSSRPVVLVLLNMVALLATILADRKHLRPQRLHSRPDTVSHRNS